MKKIFIYIVVLFYFLLSVGITTNIHFCKDKVRSISFSTSAKTTSCCGKKKMKKGCCKNVNLHFKKQGIEKLQTQDKIPLPSNFIPSVQNLEVQVLASLCVNESGSLFLFRPPPKSSFPLIYIKNCSFLI